MPETGGENIEIAHHLNEGEEHEHAKGHAHLVVEVIEAVILSLIAVTTAWSG